MYHVTYDIVTPESAEQGDCAESGYIGRLGHVRTDILDGIKPTQVRDDCRLTLRQALKLMGCCGNSGFWFTETDGRIDCHTGGEERRSLHVPDHITGASYHRIGRMLGVRG
jgi:hypothetical protein